jgi:hypothetical protein
MKKLIPIALLLAASCGDNKKSTVVDGPDEVTGDGFHQVEHLARPGINEVLLFTTDFALGYNATAPSFAGVPEPTLQAVVTEAKTVLKALYLGVCLLDGVAGLTATTGLKPAGMPCAEVGGNIFVGGNPLTGTVLTDVSKAAAQAYADAVFKVLIPDVMRIDTSADSGYLTLCGAGPDAPLLCGGRKLNDDAIDITYFFLLDGADGTHTATQFKALTSDGVNFSTTAAAQQGAGSRFTFADTSANTQQGHPSISDTFPYSGAPH